MIESDPSGKFVVGTDLGTDTIHTWRLNQQSGKLDLVHDATVPAGDGPRHFAFHPNGRWLYSIQEEASTAIFSTLTRRRKIEGETAGFDLARWFRRNQFHF